MVDDDVAGQIARLIAGYARDEDEPALNREQMWAYEVATEGYYIDVVTQAVSDFHAGRVARKKGTRHMPPTPDEFGARIAELAKEKPRTSAGELTLNAPAFGPLWGVKVYQRLLAGPDSHYPAPTKFLKSMIDEGGARGEEYRLHHQAAVGFRAVNLMFEQAADGKPSVVEKSLEPATKAVEPVPVDGYRINEWRSEHGYRGWPWFPAFGQMRVVYLPSGGPTELPNFEKVLKSITKGKMP